MADLIFGKLSLFQFVSWPLVTVLFYKMMEMQNKPISMLITSIALVLKIRTTHKEYVKTGWLTVVGVCSLTRPSAIREILV